MIIGVKQVSVLEIKTFYLMFFQIIKRRLFPVDEVKCMQIVTIEAKFIVNERNEFKCFVVMRDKYLFLGIS